MRIGRTAFMAVAALILSTSICAQEQVPTVAWRIPLGTAPANPGEHKPEIQGMIDDGPYQGAPVGGIGAGTFSRTTQGNFARWHLKAGVHKYQNIAANQFAIFAQPQGGTAVAQVLSTAKPEHGVLSAWNWSYPAGAGEYAALYPKSWYVYNEPQLPVRVTVEQFSPILPDNYKESSYPVALYNWYVENPGQKPVTVSLLFSWTNMIGWVRDSTRNFQAALSTLDFDQFHTDSTGAGSMKGIVFDRKRTGPVTEEWDGQFAIAALAGNGVEVSYLADFQPFGSGAEVWDSFAKDGTLPNIDPDVVSAGEPLAGAIAVKFTLGAGEKKMVPMALAWDLPIIQFGSGRKWVRHYTHFFGTSGTNAWAIAKTALENDQQWNDAIDAWQRPYLNDQSKPAWYRAELFNELYDVADGGTMWAYPQPSDPTASQKADPADDTFSYLECFDYLYYGTLDVRFYGSFPLIRFWPDLEKQEMREFTKTIAQSIPQQFMWAWKSDREHRLVLMPRKVAGAAPHDLGSPLEDPFVLPNQYNYQNVSDWRDLNSKYVLLIWRDYALSGHKDTAFLQDSYPAVKEAMEYLRRYDTNGDGLIENGGFPDQTYDNWVARGESAYSGGLYLAALRAETEIAKALHDSAAATQTDALFRRAQASFVKKLWNGTYFDYDTSSPYAKDIMAEQLAGQWYATLTGLGDLVPPQMRRSALQHVFDYNVMKFQDGRMGAVNGIGPEGQPLTENEQVEEVWTGTTFGVASDMLAEGLRQQAFDTAKGVNNVVWQERGYWFRTPEAYNAKGQFRASMYMRPGAIWSMEYAADQK